MFGLFAKKVDLHQLVAEGDAAELVRELQSNPKRVSEANEGGASPLHIACKRNRADLVGALIQRGADIGARDSTGQVTGLQSE